MSNRVAHVMSELDVRKEYLVVQFKFHRQLEHGSGILVSLVAKNMSAAKLKM
jgi:hypothetical protein